MTMQPPGPRTVPFVFGVLTRGFLDYTGRLWREHGDVFQVRIGSRSLILAIHPDAVMHVNVSGRQNYEKLASYDLVRDYLTGQGLVTSTGDLWRRQRQLMAPFFTPAGIRTYGTWMLRDAERLVQRWNRLAQGGDDVEMGEEMTQVTASIILRTMFGVDTTESMRGMKESVEAMVSFVDKRMLGVSLPLWLPTPQNRRYVVARKLVHELIANLIAERKATREEEWPDDLLSRLMKARDKETGEPMSDGLLRDEAITTFFAGHETTARTLTFAWYALAANPQVTQCLHEELDRVLGGRTPTMDDLALLPYALQVVKEVLRLYPAAPFYVRDAVDDDKIGGFDIPRGAAVMLSPYYTHRHPEFWPEPDVFDPDRWKPEREAGRHRYAYHPFAAGPRICIGNNFSLLESHLLLAVLAQRFAPRLKPNYVARWRMQGVLGLTHGLPMVIAAR